jgi:tetratricopeptide (TPR) repeat protein
MPNPRFKIVLMLLTCAAPAAPAGTATHFLTHGPSAAAYGRGETGAASADDLASVHYNPALLADMPRRGVSLSYYPLYDGTRYSHVAFSQHISSAVSLGASVINLTSGDIELRQKIDDTPSVIQATQWAYQLTAAARLDYPRPWDVGATLKYVMEDFVRAQAGGVGLDLGIAGTLTGPKLWGNTSRIRIGAAVQNLVQPRLRPGANEETLAAYYRLGASFSVPVYYRLRSCDAVSLSVDAQLAENMTYFSEGLEYALAGDFFFRAGYRHDHPTAGFGYRIGPIRLDYAADFGPLDAYNRFCLSYYWDNPSPGRTARTSSTVDPLMTEAQRSLKEARQQKAMTDRVVRPLFRAARRDYRKKRYLSAADQFRDIMLRYPEYESARLYYRRITDEMVAVTSMTHLSDFESLAYARGYMAYRTQNFGDALNEWEKVLQIDPDRDEVSGYGARVRKYLKDEAARENEMKARDNVRRAFDEAMAEYADRRLVAAIKKLEKVQAMCRDGAFPESLEWFKRAQEHIESAVHELARTIPGPGRKQAPEPVPLPAEIDERGAERKYTEGLILYARGKYTEASKAWEIALRLNPGHEKARTALLRAKEETNGR